MESIVLVALLNQKREILLGLKNGKWCLLGGHVDETDPSREKATAREILEESKISGSIYGLDLLFNVDVSKNSQLRMTDVYVANYFGDTLPTPLLSEGIIQLKWFTLADAQKLCLTDIAKRAVAMLAKTDERSVSSICNHLLQIISSLNQKQEVNKMVAKNKNVVLVDDHILMLETLRDGMEFCGYTVFPFSSPTEALDFISLTANRIDALVVDYAMPIMSGIYLIEISKKFLSAGTVIILMSGEDISIEEEEIFFLKKPILFEDLIQAIERSRNEKDKGALCR